MNAPLSAALPLEKLVRNRNGVPPGQTFTIVPNQAEKPQIAGLISEKTGEAEKAVQDPLALDRDATEELVEKTAELLSAFDRELKYEVKAEADVVQMLVIDSSDGRVVRKVPADEVIKFIEHLKAQIDDHVDVLA